MDGWREGVEEWRECVKQWRERVDESNGRIIVWVKERVMRKVMWGIIV